MSLVYFSSKATKYLTSTKTLNRIPFLLSIRNSSIKAGRYQQNRVGIIGAPLDRGQAKGGTEDGPRTCRDSGFIPYLANALNLNVKDYGDIEFGFPKRIEGPGGYSTSSDNKNYGNLKNLPEVANANQQISKAVQHILLEDRISLTLGGDHSVAIGSVHGVSEIYNDLAVLWVDAHADINTSPTTVTGNIHGMPVAFLIKELEPYMEKFSEFDWLTPRICASNIAYIGLRDVDFAERCIMEKFGITAYSMKEVDKLGIRAVTRMALDKITSSGIRPLHLSFDIDALDDAEVITTGTIVPGGLTLREAHVLLEEVHSTQLMVSMDFVEVNPNLGQAADVKRTLSVVKQLLTTVFGNQRGGVSAGMKIMPIYPEIEFTPKQPKTIQTKVQN